MIDYLYFNGISIQLRRYQSTLQCIVRHKCDIGSARGEETSYSLLEYAIIPTQVSTEHTHIALNCRELYNYT